MGRNRRVLRPSRGDSSLGEILRSVPWWQVGLALSSLGLIVLGVVGFRAAALRIAESPLMDVRRIDVDGATGRVTKEQVIAASGIGPGSSWLDLDCGKISAKLRENPWIEKVRVVRPFPGRVRLLVQECVPVAVVVFDGDEYGLSRDLRILPGGSEKDAPLPRIRGTLSESSLERAAKYASAVLGLDTLSREQVELVIERDGPDVVRLPEKSFTAKIECRLEPARALESVSAFLEVLDGKGASRGTLRFISEGTAVWEAKG